MTDKTLFRPDWYQDPNDNRIHDENGDDILDKHSLGELQKIGNNHSLLIDALIHAHQSLRTFSPAVPQDEQGWTSFDSDALAVIEEALEQVKL